MSSPETPINFRSVRCESIWSDSVEEMDIVGDESFDRTFTATEWGGPILQLSPISAGSNETPTALNRGFIEYDPLDKDETLAPETPTLSRPFRRSRTALDFSFEESPPRKEIRLNDSSIKLEFHKAEKSSGSVDIKTPVSENPDRTLPIPFSGDHDFSLKKRTPFQDISNISDPERKLNGRRSTSYCRTVNLTGMDSVSDHKDDTEEYNQMESACSKFSEEFINLGIIGKGTFAVVHRVLWKKNGSIYAVKRGTKKFRGRRDCERAFEEAEALRLCSCVNVVAFECAWQENMVLYIQMELCKYGSLQGLVNRLHSKHKKSNRVPSSTLWKIIHDVSSALCHIHNVGYAHLDLKPENIFLCESGTLKVGDFGLATKFDTSGIDGHEGDPKYLADEVLNKCLYLSSADMFSLGISLFELATGMDLPSNGSLWHDFRKNFDTKLAKYIADRPRNFVTIIKNSMKDKWDDRPSAHELLRFSEVVEAGKKADNFLFKIGKENEKECQESLSRTLSYEQTERLVHTPSRSRRP